MTTKQTSALALLCLSLLVAVGVYTVYTGWHVRRFGITFFDIGQGDAALIRFRNGEGMLVDCGADRKILSKLGQALPFYDRTLEYLLVTHPDLDHYGGCVDVLRRYDVKQIILNGYGKPGDPYWEEWNRAVRYEPGADIQTISSPAEWDIAGTTLQFLAPDRALRLQTAADDSNNYSIVFRLEDPASKFTALFTADMEEPLERALLEKYCPASGPCARLQAGILKVGHHGSDSSSGVSFLQAVAPRRAIVSVGRNNRYGHPSRRVFRRLERVGAAILRTDEEGDILLP